MNTTRGFPAKKATFKQYAQAIPGAFAIQKADKAPCRLACPGGLNVQGYVQMVKEGKYKEALEIINAGSTTARGAGRICPHGCEDACDGCEVDQAVAIRDLKRLAADKFDPREIKIACAPARSEKVAVIGSGPAGVVLFLSFGPPGHSNPPFEGRFRSREGCCASAFRRIGFPVSPGAGKLSSSPIWA